MKLRTRIMKTLATAAIALSLIFLNNAIAMNDTNTYANIYDKELSTTFAQREQDWRNGALVYQVLVDRFAPAQNLEAKKHLYPAPKVLRAWTEKPKAGKYLEQEQLWSHEIEFWGGDLQSLQSNLDYIHQLGMDVLYLNPIHYGYTNHKYDSLDYKKVSPEFGTRDDVISLARRVHEKNMKIVLDGVFNHMGRNAEIFQKAQSDPDSPYRDWFYLGDQYPDGHRGWATVANLPEINLENKAVREHVYATEDSVVQQYLADGIDGWRLDVAFDIGFTFLQELTEAAHQRKPGSLVVGEIWNYPREWFPSIDGIMNFTAREIIWRMCLGEIDAHTAGHMLERMIKDADYEHLLKSWLVLDNHDTLRLKNMLGKTWQQRMAQVLQFTLPGSPNLYYGTELGMTGGYDPEMRGPMRWDLVTDDNPVLNWTRQLIKLRKENRALKIGNFRSVTSHKLLAFERYTDRVAETVIVVANPGKKRVSEYIMVANSKLMNAATIEDQLGTLKSPLQMRSGLLQVTLGPGEIAALKPNVSSSKGYTPYKRVQ